MYTDSMWTLFAETGAIAYYLLYKVDPCAFYGAPGQAAE